MKKINLIICLFILSGSIFATETWNILDKSMAAWNVNGGLDINKAWIFTKSGSGSIPASAVTQESGYVNIIKTYTAPGYNYGFLTPPALTLQSNTAYTFEVKARIKPIDKTTFPDITPPASGQGGFESNQISARLNNKNMAIHLKYGDENEGYISLQPAVSHTDEEKYKINTAEWHVYRFIFHADNLKYDVYIDSIEDPIFENVATTSMTGSNILRLGAETNQRCNMDIEYAKMGTGDFSSKPKITSVSVSSDSHVVNHERTISVNVNTTLINAGEKLTLSFLDKNGMDVLTPAEVIVTSDITTMSLTIPASVPVGKYEIKVSAATGLIGSIPINPKSIQYVVVEESPLDLKILPQVKPVGFITEIDDYIFKGPSNEFIFPALIDANTHAINGKFVNGQDTLARYYRFYTPHENPGGMYLATGPSLDGPWTERNTVIDLNWAKAIPDNVINTATHISACQVIWNSVSNKYFMYFHGPNTTTHYATSDNLVDWTFGGNVVNAKQFSTAGTEASYSKVFEHEIPGLGNKYVMMLMIMENIRRIYWAYSNDGINWTPVKKPLISPDLDYKKIPGTDIKPNYYSSSMGNNVSGPYLMEKNGRCFVFCNGSSGNICVVEVGQSFDMEVHWGEYLKSSDVVIDKDDNGNSIAVPRVAAPVFMQNDAGKWYMFFEAGSRLGANIAYAKDADVTTSFASPRMNSSTVSIYPTLLKRGQQMTVKAIDSKILHVDIFDTLGKKLYSSNYNHETVKMEVPYTRGVYLVKTTMEDSSVHEAKIMVTE